MKYVKLGTVIVLTVVLGWITNIGLAFAQVQCTEVSMLTARDPMGPIWLYKQYAAMCGAGPAAILIVGLILLGLMWYFAYIKKMIKEN